MKVLGLDFETTGLEAAFDRVIEVGAVIWDTELKKPLSILSELVQPDPMVEVKPEIEKITSISTSMLEDYGINSKSVFERLATLIEKVDYIAAHNAPFDREFLETEMNRHQITYTKKPWIDTVVDVPYPDDIVTRKLTYLAADHGIVNQWAHRAMFDVLTMLAVLDKYEIDQVVERSQSPRVEVVSHVSYQDRDKAKNMGFRWNVQERKWCKDMKKCDLDHIEFPFKVSVFDKSM